MHPLPLVVFLTLAAGPDRTIPAGCREDFETCREDCTIDYGGGTTKYRQLSECIHRCDKEQKECTSQHYSLRDANIEPLPAREPTPAPREPETHDASDRDTPAPASGTEPPRDAEPAMTEEPEPESEPEPAPKPAPKRAEPPRPKPPAEPKKDISDWDPDAD